MTDHTEMVVNNPFVIARKMIAYPKEKKVATRLLEIAAGDGDGKGKNQSCA
ncbi:MAG: hypothetical protein ABIO86_01220 [Sphingomonas sp.]